MQLLELNSGLIYTNSNCIGCNKCISGCVAVGANVVVKQTGSERYGVSVDPNKCILCGHCVDECVHDARTYRDDTDAFFDALEQGEDITILVSPSLLTDYESQYNNILGYLKHLGAHHIYNASFGADLMIWVYLNFILNFGLDGVISQLCPVIVNYLEKYKPQLLDYLIPVQSPMMCTAIYVGDYLKNTDKLAYISPCIARKFEMNDVNTYGKVSYNVTFERLMKRLEEVDISPYSAEDELPYGLGALIPSAGGLTANLEQFIGFSEVLIQTTGPDNIFPYFDHYAKIIAANKELPFMVDALNCTNGCIFGTATSCGVELRNEATFSAHRSKERAYSSGIVPTGTYEARIRDLNKRFQNLELSSFVRQFDNTRGIIPPVLAEEQFEEIYCSMYKYTPEHRCINCGACGYKTCRDMAYAIGTHVNHKENCINYTKECVRLETEKTTRLLAEISAMNEELKETAQLKSNFLANMSHEIRTPMNAVIGMAEMALRGALPDEERGYIQQIKASGRSLLAIINDILDFSKIESGKMELNESEYTIMSIINDTVNIVMTRIGEKNITLVVDAAPDLPFKLYGDDIRIKQVLMNFASNAVKFTESGCVEIVMDCDHSGDYIFMNVAIRDTGIGIKAEDLDSLFHSFQQVDSKRNRNIEGTGLGLVISRELVSLMHGEIHVESVYGSGSTFSFRIPQKIVENIPSAALRSEKPSQSASFIANPYVRIGYLNAVNRLRVQNTNCDTFEALEDAARDGVAYVFLDYLNWNEETDRFARTHPELQTVVIVDQRKEIVSQTYVRKLSQPVYSLSLAAVFNHEWDMYSKNDTHEENLHFEAPEAHILIVDDNAVNLTVAKGLLSPMHMQIQTASGAREALRMLADTQYDIVFMDHMMPDIDGIEATHMIREMEGEYYKTLPIIALTANAINNAKQLFLNEGMDDFVAKPIEMVDITNKLKRWLPPEKVKSIGQKSKEARASEVPAKEALPVIEGLDVRAGVALSGTLELYQKILAVYHAAIAQKADLIERYQQSEDIEAYTIEVHALKSASKLIGATVLSELAARLERCGHANEVEPIRAETSALLELYRSYLPLLAPYGNQAEAPEQEVVLSVVLLEKLAALYSALDDFDLDAASDMLGELRTYLLDDRQAALRDKLCQTVEAMEYDDAAAQVDGWRQSLSSDV